MGTADGGISMERRQNLDFHPAEEKLSGVVEHIIFASNDGAFSVFRLRLERQGKCTVTTKGAAPLVGQEVLLSGTWITHPRVRPTVSGAAYESQRHRRIQQALSAFLLPVQLMESGLRWHAVLWNTSVQRHFASSSLYRTV